ncbi:MAG: hypothetical protein E7L17_12965 [Clostridium sp.]|uniref:hypothetical protein n=1 Tax=Clostridium sp. TaxID=1506 RepID=UPI0029150D23|nr:hypothetical protein [Clostridium sp.]MDU7339012.1 hypothetical protein [Clostridium sp.]
MTGRLSVLARVIKRSVNSGETRDNVLASYILLTQAEKDLIISEWDNIVVDPPAKSLQQEIVDIKSNMALADAAAEYNKGVQA